MQKSSAVQCSGVCLKNGIIASGYNLGFLHLLADDLARGTDTARPRHSSGQIMVHLTLTLACKKLLAAV